MDAERILADNRRLHRATAQAYDRLHPHMRNGFEQWLQRRDISEMVRRVSRQPPAVLDLGCGTGNLTMRFLEAGAAVTAVDMSAEMLAVLSNKLTQAPGHRDRCRLMQFDVDGFLSQPGTGRFGIVALSSVVHHLPDYVAPLVALGSRIEPGGFLYLVHEPAQRDEMQRDPFGLRRLWSVVPRGADRLLRRRVSNPSLHREWEQQDTTYADYHYHRDGISVRAISAALSAVGMKLDDTSRYNAHETSLVSWLDNHWFDRLRYEQFQRTYFRAIWQRTGP
jgi:2-polyprenyl-3-methyl-5-hydroxy-6-metoxy-1,4-benzoquinol methylase